MTLPISSARLKLAAPDRPFIERLLPAPLDGGFAQPDHWVWCGSVIRDDRRRYHMFASMWSRRVPFNPNWLTNSIVVRAESATPEGPYQYIEPVLSPRDARQWDGRMTHNPTIHRCPRTGRYLLFYTGSTYRGPEPTAGPPTEEQRLEARANQRIGLAIADRPAGPWQRCDRPILEPRPGHWDALLTTNPAPCLLPDGSLLLAYKSTAAPRAPLQYGMARADRYDAPYTRLQDEPLLAKATLSSVSYEDAYLWRSPCDFEMLFNDMTGHFTGEDHAGAHALSEDGLHWRLAAAPKAYSRTVRWADGSVTTQGSFERPQLLIQDGKPTHLFAATADGPGGFWNATRTWNMVVPLATDQDEAKVSIRKEPDARQA